jgi:hypothetical protein
VVPIPAEKQAASNHGVRISDFLKTSRGQKFITKQVGLQLSNTRIESLDLFSTTANNITKKLGGKLEKSILQSTHVEIRTGKLVQVLT